MAPFWDALLIIGLVATNAFFAAAEYSLLSVRRTELEHLAGKGNPHARQALNLLSEVGLLITGTLLGMAIVSLLMGWLGESIIASAIEQLFEGRRAGLASLAAVHVFAATVAFLLMTGLLMILGELVPKAVALDRADRVALLVARPMAFYLRIGRYPVVALEAVSDATLSVLGYKPTEGRRAAHSPEEVKLIVAAIRKRGLLGKGEERMIRSIFELHGVRVREVMIPWPKVARIPFPKDWSAALAAVLESGHAHLPVYEDSPEHITGILRARDLLRIAAVEKTGALEGAPPLRALLLEPVIVPESMPLNQALEELQRRGAAVALVVDEFGTYTGMLTVRDVIEQIVGEMRDGRESPVPPPVQKTSDALWTIDGSVSLRELAQEFEIELPRDAGYETLAGFALAQLGTIPKEGDYFTFAGRRYTVAEMDQRRVARVKVEKIAAMETHAATATPQRAG